VNNPPIEPTFTMPVALRAHGGQDELGQPQQPEHVGLELAAHVLHVQFFEQPVDAVAGVVDQDRDDPVLRLDRPDRRGHRPLIGDVQRERAAADGLESVQRRGTARRGVGDEPGGGKRRRGRLADARGRARDHGDAPVRY